MFSAARVEASPLLQLWRLKNVRLSTSMYAIEEVRRNLRDVDSVERLNRLVETLVLTPEADVRLIPSTVRLRDKDRPILAAAIAAGSSFLITGDHRDFGPYFGKMIAGVRILRPAEFITAMAPT
jgi:predicted nucleic acid-binding protein